MPARTGCPQRSSEDSVKAWNVTKGRAARWRSGAASMVKFNECWKRRRQQLIFSKASVCTRWTGFGTWEEAVSHSCSSLGDSLFFLRKKKMVAHGYHLRVRLRCPLKEVREVRRISEVGGQAAAAACAWLFSRTKRKKGRETDHLWCQLMVPAPARGARSLHLRGETDPAGSQADQPTEPVVSMLAEIGADEEVCSSHIPSHCLANGHRSAGVSARSLSECERICRR